MDVTARREHQPLLGYSSDEETAVRTAARGAEELRGRAASKVRGAAAIMHKWPDHVTTSMYNYWVAFFLFILVFVIVYGMIITFSVIPNNRIRYGRGLASRPKDFSAINRNFESSPKNMQVFCSIIVNSEKLFNISKHIKNMKTIIKDFPNYTFNVIVLINDTEIDAAKENNEIAMNTLMKFNGINSLDEEVNIEKYDLRSYLDNSPLNKTWKTLSPTMIPFLIRAVTIWEGGGIAFDLNAISEHSNRPSRLKKEIIQVLHDFAENITEPRTHASERVVNIQPHKTLINNIQDVIANLENNEIYLKHEEDYMKSEETQLLAEPELSRTVTMKKRSVEKISRNDEVLNILHDTNESSKSIEILTPTTDKPVSSNVKHTISNDTNMKMPTNKNIPYFIKVLFNAVSGSNYISKSFFSQNIVNGSKTQNEIGHSDIDQRNYYKGELNDPVEKNKNYKNIKKREKHNPIFEIIKLNEENHTKNIKNNSDSSINARKYDDMLSTHSALTRISDKTESPLVIANNINLVLDMEGELIATNANCHAFVGQIFSTIQKYPNIESTRNLIDKTLKIFCHEKFDTSCYGIKLLL